MWIHQLKIAIFIFGKPQQGRDEKRVATTERNHATPLDPTEAPAGVVCLITDQLWWTDISDTFDSPASSVKYPERPDNHLDVRVLIFENVCTRCPAKKMCHALIKLSSTMNANGIPLPVALWLKKIVNNNNSYFNTKMKSGQYGFLPLHGIFLMVFPSWDFSP